MDGRPLEVVIIGGLGYTLATQKDAIPVTEIGNSFADDRLPKCKSFGGRA